MDLSSVTRNFKRNDNMNPVEFIGGFPKKGVSIIASKPGVGKTWYVLHYTLTLGKQGNNVACVFGDCPPELIYHRINKMEGVNEESEYYSEHMRFLFLTDIIKVKESIYINTDQGLHNLCLFLKESKADIVFLDTLASLTTGEESSQKDMSEIFQRLMVVAESFNCALVIVHHLRKSSRKERDMKPDLDDIIGSSIITRLASLVIVLSKDTLGGIFAKIVKNWYEDQGIIEGIKLTDTSEGKVKISNLRSYSRARSHTAMAKDEIYKIYQEQGEGALFPIEAITSRMKIGTTLAREVIGELLLEKQPIIRVVENIGMRKKYYTPIAKNIEALYNNDIPNKGEDNTNGSNH